MRYLVALLAFAGLVVSCFALREHYRTEPAPCSIDDRWDCGAVNHSPFAKAGGEISLISPGLYDFMTAHSQCAKILSIPVAAIGIAGYAAIAALALARRWWLVLLFTTVAVGFSAYLTYIEARILEAYCIWCVTSAGIIALTEIAAIVGLVRSRR